LLYIQNEIHNALAFLLLHLCQCHHPIPLINPFSHRTTLLIGCQNSLKVWNTLWRVMTHDHYLVDSWVGPISERHNMLRKKKRQSNVNSMWWARAGLCPNPHLTQKLKGTHILDPIEPCIRSKFHAWFRLISILFGTPSIQMNEKSTWHINLHF
jgi:hypothetical protein